MTRFFDNENQNFEFRKNDFSHKQWRSQPDVLSILFQSRAAKKAAGTRVSPVRKVYHM